MTRPVPTRLAMKELGVAGTNVRFGGELKADEFLPELRGRKAIKKYREMADNDATIGAILHAMTMMLRDVKLDVLPAEEGNAEAQAEADFIKSILEDMEHSMEDFISSVLSFLPYGFSIFEVVYKTRRGTDSRSPKFYSKFSDGRVGVRKLAPRAQWTIERFEFDPVGEITHVVQDGILGQATNRIPIEKCLHFRTSTMNNEPSGRSVLRNAYTAYHYLSHLQNVEAIATERELNGIPIGRMPAEYLSSEAGEDQVALRQQLEKVLRDVKFNDQGYILLPSDQYVDDSGKPSGERLMDVELISSNGTRNIDIDPVIKRYQQDISRSVMAEFLMLGANERGSFALSKSKTDLFLRALEGYMHMIVSVLNRQLVTRLWMLNGLDFRLMPKIKAGDVAPHDLRELGSYLRNLNGANIDLSSNTEIVNALLQNAELPLIDSTQQGDAQ